LARQRAGIANRLIPSDLREGGILDVGCGSFPLFLTSTSFAEKWGVDRVLTESTTAELRLQGIELVAFDADQDDRLPFEDDKFSVVTMLAVYEHLAEDRLKLLLAEISRVLKPRGIFVMTTPAHWTDPLLTVMASVGLISSEELNEHKRSHRHQDIRPLLEQAGFPRHQIRMGFFEARMNLWAVAAK
jgi:SAM-dependent methyltransferase